jgi:hypothetical protein
LRTANEYFIFKFSPRFDIRASVLDRKRLGQKGMAHTNFPVKAEAALDVQWF